MATIKKREGKTGVSYLIRVSCGYDLSGKQVVRSMSWRPAPGMKPKQIEKELERQAVLFEEKCAAQGEGKGNIKFEALAHQWFKEYAETNNRPRTVARLHQLEGRTYAALGHIRVDKLTARHIQNFVNDLGKDGVSSKGSYATAKVDVKELLEAKKITQKDLSEQSGVSRSTVSSFCRGEGITMASAEKLSQALGCKTREMFVIRKGEGRLSVKSIQHYLNFVSSVLDYAFRFGMIPDNPCRRVILPAGKQKERECYTIEEAQAFLESLGAAPIKYRAFCILAIYGGLRRGELLGLEWNDVDFQNQVVKVRRTSQYLKERGTYTDDTKTKRSQRTLKLPVAVFDVLRKLRSEQLEMRLMMGAAWKDTGRLFVSEDGAPMHPNTPYQWLRKFCERTGQRFLGVHMFRHLNASLLINSGVDVKTVSASLGHSQVTTTLNIYAHSFSEAQAKASEAVADLLENRGEAAG